MKTGNKIVGMNIEKQTADFSLFQWKMLLPIEKFHRNWYILVYLT